MLQPLTVVYLHTPTPDDARLLPDMEYGFSDAFRAVCREFFAFAEPRDFPRLKLVSVDTPKAMDELLFNVKNDRHFLSDAAKQCCLFLLDDAIAPDPADDSGQGEPGLAPIDSFTLDGLSLTQWFLTYFPAIPKVVLTTPGHKRIRLPARRWIAKSRSVLENPVLYRKRIQHLFSSFWEPRFWTALREYVCTKAGTNWHTPGHNGGKALEQSPFLQGMREAMGPLSFRADLSVSVERLGDLSSPESQSPLSESQRLASEIFGTAQTCFVTNGTSTSNKAMLMTLLRPGEVVLLDRNCHKSVHHAVVMSGAIPRYLPAHYNSRLGVWGPIPLEDLRGELFRQYPPSRRPRMLIITTCTYEGILYPVWEIGRMCEKAGLLFYADEAWAPYLNFHPFYTRTLADNSQVRYNAVNELSGAHFAVQSTHKALAAFSQASMIHVSTRFKALLESDASRQFRWLRKRFVLHGHGSYEKFSHDLHEFLRYWHSTSPHYPMLATLDVAGIQMRLEGLRIIEERLHWVAAFKKRVADECGRPVSECFADLDSITGDGARFDGDGYMHDPLKMIIVFRNEKARVRFEKQLHSARIQWEKATPVTILFLVTAGTVEEHFEYLFRVCRQNRDLIGAPEEEFRIPSIPAAINEQVSVLPRDAALCDGELVPLDSSEGRIAGQLLVPYPPGIPVFLPGLRITRPMIDLIRDVIATEGAKAVHGLFVRGRKVLVEVLNKDEESRVEHILEIRPPDAPKGQ